MKKWNLKNTLWMLIYMILYVIVTVFVCMTGIIHPIFFVCYQITAGILLTGIVFKAFDKVRAPGVAGFLSAGLIIMLFIIQDVTAWHIVPVIIIAAAAEAFRFLFRYNRMGDIIGTVIMTFSTFGYYSRIWLGRAYTYEVAIEEMPVGYADTLMLFSPIWTLPLVLFIGIALSILMQILLKNHLTLKESRKEL